MIQSLTKLYQKSYCASSTAPDTVDKLKELNNKICSIEVKDIGKNSKEVRQNFKKPSAKSIGVRQTLKRCSRSSTNSERNSTNVEKSSTKYSIK